VDKPTAYRGDEPYAFVAYSHRDADRVHDEIRQLAAQGYRVYYDDGIHPGQRWREEIAGAIDGSRIFIFFVSPHSVVSDDCLRELNYALELGKPFLAVHLVPTVLPGGVKLAISDRQAINAFELSPRDYRLRLAEALRTHLPDADPPVEAARPAAPLPPSRATGKRSAILPLAALIALIGIGTFWWLQWESGDAPVSVSEPQMDRADALERLRDAEQLAAEDHYGRAFYVLRRIAPVLDGHPRLATLQADILSTVTPRIREDGAEVFFRPRELGVDTEWIALGETPLQPFSAPLGILEFRIAKAGYHTRHFLVANPGVLLGNHDPFAVGDGPFPFMELVPDGDTGRVGIPATRLSVVLQGTPQAAWGTEPIDLPAFRIDEREVTNREFKEFVDAGGYRDEQLWLDLTFEDGRPFRLAEQADALTDTTGRPAPAGWELGNYPGGTADEPVGGISWFEAMAYARFRGRSLPTVYHWARAAQGPEEAAYATVNLAANLGNYSSPGPRPASAEALGPWGTTDMAGNVREWVQNATSKGRIAMGGSWNDYASNYFQIYSIPPLDRSADNGLRLVDQSPPIDPELLESVALLTDTDRPFREPVSDAYFEGMRSGFVAAAEPPIEVTREVIEQTVDQQIEEIVLRYRDGATFTLYLGLPIPFPARTQSVIYMPHGGAFLAGQTPNRNARFHFDGGELDFIVRSGRAAIVPIWKGSRERYLRFIPRRQHEAAPAWYDDLGRTMTFIRDDPVLDEDKVAFMGFSYGALFGSLLLGLDERLKTGVLISGGIYNVMPLEASFDVTNYAPRIRQPVLMVNGRFDPIVPWGLSQQRLLELLPNPANQQVLFDELGHYGFPRHRFYRAVTDWLDEQLGPVR